VNERKLKVATLAVESERVFDYVYDYGDNWCCVIVLEDVAVWLKSASFWQRSLVTRRSRRSWSMPVTIICDAPQNPLG
jgi:hypothetical protein